MTTIQSRRKLIVIVLLCLAVGGALLRHFAAQGSMLRDIGTLLMLIWLPVVGNIVGWLMARIRRPRGAISPIRSMRSAAASPPAPNPGRRRAST